MTNDPSQQWARIINILFPEALIITWIDQVLLNCFPYRIYSITRILVAFGLVLGSWLLGYIEKEQTIHIKNNCLNKCLIERRPNIDKYWEYVSIYDQVTLFTVYYLKQNKKGSNKLSVENECLTRR